MNKAVLAIILLSTCFGCSKDKASSQTEAEDNYSFDDWWLSEEPLYVPAADGTIYAAVRFDDDEPRILWLVGKSAVTVQAMNLQPSRLRYAAADLHGGLHVPGATSFWYLKDGKAFETKIDATNDVRPEDHVITQRSLRWAAARMTAHRTHADSYDEGFNEGLEEGQYYEE